MKLEFNHFPDRDCIAEGFPESPFFSEEAMGYRDAPSEKAGMLAAYIGNQAVGVLTWNLSPLGKEVHIGLVEVHKNYRGQNIGPRLLLELEGNHKRTIESIIGYANNPENIASHRMFQKAGYTSYDTHRYGKILSFDP